MEERILELEETVAELVEIVTGDLDGEKEKQCLDIKKHVEEQIRQARESTEALEASEKEIEDRRKEQLRRFMARQAYEREIGLGRDMPPFAEWYEKTVARG